MTIGVAKNMRKLRDTIGEFEEVGDLMWAHGFVTAIMDTLEEKIRAKNVEAPVTGRPEVSEASKV